MYEFQSIKEFEAAKKERAEAESDKIEEEKDQEAQSWADMMEAEEEATQQVVQDPSQHPDNIKWMQDQMTLHKEQFGEDFGEDLNLDFNSPPILEDE